MKEKIIFIGHSYHKKTHSDQFMIDYLREFYDVEIYYDDSWNQNSSAPDYSEIAHKNCKAIVFWTIFPTKKIIKKLPGKNIIFFPMYEECLKLNFRHWKKLRKIKIINFSSTLHQKLKKFGLKSCYLQYFPKPQEFCAGKENEVFFWQRPRLFVNINNLPKLLQNGNYKIHIHEEINLAKKLIADSLEFSNHKISYSEWFENKNELVNLIKQKAIYIAPRLMEGIGMSFLEAMAMGKVVIAHNAPTMNEYIEDGKNGFLFDDKNPQKIDFSKLREIQENAYKYIQKGYGEWCKNRKIIIDIIENKRELKVNYLKLMINFIGSKIKFNQPLTTKMKLKKLRNKIKNALFPSYKLARKFNNRLHVLEDAVNIIVDKDQNKDQNLDKTPNQKYLENHNSFFVQKFKIKDSSFNYPENKKIFFLHIPKTGGRTVAHGFIRLYQMTGSNMLQSNLITREALVKRTAETISLAQKFKIIQGHLPYGCHKNMQIKDGDISYFTLVRHPVKHLFSMYNYLFENFHLPKSIDFDSFIKMTNNIQTKLLAGFNPIDENHYNMIENFINDKEIDADVYNQAINNIEKHFFLVGPTERLEDVMRVFITIMDLPNIITHSINEGKIKLLDKMTDEQIAQIKKNNHWDIKLHEYVSERFSKIYDKLIDLNKDNLNKIHFMSEEEESDQNSDIVIAGNVDREGHIIPTKIKAGKITLYSKFITKR